MPVNPIPNPNPNQTQAPQEFLPLLRGGGGGGLLAGTRRRPEAEHAVPCIIIQWQLWVPQIHHPVAAMAPTYISSSASHDSHSIPRHILRHDGAMLLDEFAAH